jgi:sugar diacid utilization regulator
MNTAESVTEHQVQQAINQASTEKRLENVITYNLIHGLIGPDSRNHILTQASYVGVDLLQPHAVLAVEFAKGKEDEFKKFDNFNNQPFLHTPANPLRVMIVAVDSNESRAIKKVAVNHFSSLTSANQPEASVGIGKVPKSLADYKNSWYQAVAALKLGQIGSGPGNVTHLNDLGVMSLLFDHPQHDQLRAYQERVLSPVTTRSSLGKTTIPAAEMLETLDVYYRANENMDNCADLLSIHVNTLKYRLGIIYKLFQFDNVTRLKDHDVATELSMAIMINKVLPVMDFLEEVCS